MTLTLSSAGRVGCTPHGRIRDHHVQSAARLALLTSLKGEYKIAQEKEMCETKGEEKEVAEEEEEDIGAKPYKFSQL